MSATYLGQTAPAVWSPPTIPSDGDPRDAQSVNVAFQALADRSQFVLQSVETIPKSATGSPIVTLNSAAYTEIAHVDLPFEVVSDLDQIEVTGTVIGATAADGYDAAFAVFYKQLTGATAGFEDIDSASVVEIIPPAGAWTIPIFSHWMVDGTPAHFSNGKLRITIKGRMPNGAPDAMAVVSCNFAVRLVKVPA